MASLATGGDAFEDAVVFLRHFNDMPNLRQRGKVTYPLDEVLLLCLLAVLAGAETFVDIARFGDKKLDLLRRFRPFSDGTPSHDYLDDIFATLDAEQFQRCFVAWVSSRKRISDRKPMFPSRSSAAVRCRSAQIDLSSFKVRLGPLASISVQLAAAVDAKLSAGLLATTAIAGAALGRPSATHTSPITAARSRERPPSARPHRRHKTHQLRRTDR
jgi:hypothetical protein